MINKTLLCPYGKDKEDCFARKGKLCSCLQELNFKAECPFYKSKEQYEIELKKYPHIKKKKKRSKEK